MSRAITQVQTVAQALDVLEGARPGDVVVYFVESTVKSLNGLRAASAARLKAAPLFALFGKLQGTCGRNHVRQCNPGLRQPKVGFGRLKAGGAETIFVVTSMIPSKTLAERRKALDGAKQNADE